MPKRSRLKLTQSSADVLQFLSIFSRLQFGTQPQLHRQIASYFHVLAMAWVLLPHAGYPIYTIAPHPTDIFTLFSDAVNS